MSDGVWRNTPRFVEKRHNKQWMWLAIDRAARELKRDFTLEEEAGKMQGSSGNHYHLFWEARKNTEQVVENR